MSHLPQNDAIALQEAKEDCLAKLKAAKIRMSKQRLELVDLLFSGKYTCTKELYYDALTRNPELGMSTVYRFLKVLADLGVMANGKAIDVTCNNCVFRTAKLTNSQGHVDSLNLHELLRLGLIVKGVIGSEEKIAVKMVDDAISIEVQK